MATKLFLLFKSPHEFTGIDLIENIAGEQGSAAILFEDAAYYAVDKKHGKELLGAVKEVYVMSDDLIARGFEGKSGPEFKLIDYSQAVDLIMERYDQTITL